MGSEHSMLRDTLANGSLPPPGLIARTAAVATLLVSSTGLAQHRPAGDQAPSVPTITYAYEATGQCPTSDGFRARVEGRVQARLVPRRSPGAVKVIVAARAQGWESTITLPGSTRDTTRTVEGETCADVANAAALIVAMAIERGEVVPRPESKPAPRPIPVRRVPEPASHPVDVVWGAGVQGGAISAVSSGLSVRLAGLGEVVLESSPLRPSLRVGAEYASGGDRAIGTATAKLSLWAGILDVCPARWVPHSRSVSIAGCTRLRLGVLRGEGQGFEDAQAEDRTWISVGADLRLAWHFASPLYLELDVEGFAPLHRTRFFFEPSTTIHEVPSVGGAASLGVGLLFW